MAFRYLNDGNPIIPEFNIPIPDAIKETKIIIELRICVLSLLNFLTMLEDDDDVQHVYANLEIDNAKPEKALTA